MTRPDTTPEVAQPLVAAAPSPAPPLQGRLLANRFLRDNTLLLGANVMAGIFAYMLHPLLGHLMGVRAYGQVAALIALSFVLLTPTQLVATVAAKYTSSMAGTRSLGHLNDFIRRFTKILLPAGVVVAVVFALASTYVAKFFHIRSTEGVALLSLLFVVSCVTPLNLGAIQGLELFGWYATITVLLAFLRVLLAVLLVIVGLGVNGAMLGIALGGLLAYVASFQPLKTVLRGPRKPMGPTRHMWSFALLAAGAGAGMVALFSVDTVLARHYLDARDAGLYAALATIGRTALFVTSGVAVVMFPKVVVLHERRERHGHVVVHAMVGALALAAALEAVFWIFPSMVARLVFGQAFAGVAGTLPLYGLAMVFLAAAQVLVAYLLAVGNRMVVLFIFLACGLEAALIIVRHGSISQLAQAVLIANAALLAALLVISVRSSSKEVGTAAISVNRNALL